MAATWASATASRTAWVGDQHVSCGTIGKASIMAGWLIDDELHQLVLLQVP